MRWWRYTRGVAAVRACSGARENVAAVRVKGGGALCGAAAACRRALRDELYV
jgi:hypothetical protein